MNKDKRTEIANDLNMHCCSLAEQFCGEMSCNSCITNYLYNAGYRKASEVALEAVDDFQSRLRNIFCTMCNDNDYNTVCLLEIDSAIECLFDVFVAELKKKYTTKSEGEE